MTTEKLKALYEQDVKNVGIENAFKLWQWQYKTQNNEWSDCDRPLSFKPTLNYRRKNA